MTYGGKEDGGATFTLTPEEHARFKSGKPVIKKTGDNRGMATITLKMTRPKAKSRRFPVEIYGDQVKSS